jgi:uncharacterized membrane protein YqgA involved in biofilm formation
MMMKWLRTQDRNELTYWLGLLILFIGLSMSVSTATALVVVGAVMAVESVITSYLSTWMASATGTRRK